MPTVPGPFLLQSESLVNVSPGVYDFEADAIGLLGRVQSNMSGWTSLLSGPEELATSDMSLLTSIDVDGIFQGAAVAVAGSDLPGLDLATIHHNAAIAQMLQAITFSPPDSWRDPPSPYVPPGAELNILAPKIPPDAYDAQTATPVGTPVGRTGPDIELVNLTRIGSVNFALGDRFAILCIGFAGQVVTIASTLNGLRLPDLQLGILGGDGQLRVEGVMGPEAVGVWTEIYYFGGVRVKSFNFVVSGSL